MLPRMLSRLQTGLVPGLVSLVVSMLIPAPLTADEPARDREKELAAKVDAMFATWNKPDSPGCAVGIIHQDKLIYSKGFGSANLDYEVSNTPRTLFEIGSFAKAFTSLCIALLMDQGKISPDDDIRRYLPEMHKFDPPIRIRHLLTCHSGIWAQFHIMPLAGWDNIPIHTPFTEDDVLTVLSGQKKLRFEPGTQFQYGSGDYFLLGVIVKRVSGKSLAEFARDNIFKPLGMKHTFFEEDPSLVVKHRAVGHYKEADGKWRQWTNHGYLPGGSGLKTSVEDLFRWDQNFYKNRLPAGKYLNEFLKDGMVLGNRYCLDADAYVKKINPKKDDPPGKYRGLKRMQFTGGVFGMSSAMARFPEERFSVICLTNTEEIAPWTMAKEIADLYLADKMKPRPENTDPPGPRVEVKLPVEELKNKVGAYQDKEGIIFKITFKDGQLWNTNQRGETYKMKPLSATEFEPTAYPTDTFVFQRNSPREPFSLVLQWPGGSSPFRRVELVDPATLTLGDYTGEYFSDELAVPYRLKEKDGALWLRLNGRRWERLEPTLPDEFIPHKRFGHENRRIRFQRNDKKQVVGFTISFWRIKGIDFVRK